MMRLASAFVLLLLGSGLTHGCATGGSGEDLDITPPPKQTQCPKLGTALYELTVATDREAYAAQRLLQYENDSVRVVVEMASEEVEFPGGYAIEVEGQLGTSFRVLVPVDVLCDLSNEPSIRMVRVPVQAEPQ